MSRFRLFIPAYFLPTILLAIVVFHPLPVFAVVNWMNEYGGSCNDSPEDCDLTVGTDLGGGLGAACVPNAPRETGPLARQVPGSRCGNCNHAGSVCPSGQTCDSASGFCFDTTNVKACQQACAKQFMVCQSGKCVDPYAAKPATTARVSKPPGGSPTGSPSAGGSPTGSPPADAANGGGSLVNPLNSINSLPELLTAILKGVVEIGAIFLTLMIVYVGFLFVAARGNEEKIRSARDALMWTVIGGLILLGAEAISLVIQATVKTL